MPDEVGGDLGVELVLRLSNARATRVFRSLVPSTVRRQTWTSGKFSFATKIWKGLARYLVNWDESQDLS